MAEKHRLTFLDPVTGTAVPCGRDGQAPSQPSHHTLFTSLIFLTPHMHQGYVLKLPNKFLQQHGGKIRDGLTVLKCIAAIGKCAGLPLDLEGMPRNVVSMAFGFGQRSRQWPLTLAATYLTIAAAVATSVAQTACSSPRASLASGLSRQDADLMLTGRGQGRKVVRRAARQRRLRRGLPGPAHRRRELAHLIGDGQGLPGAEGIGEGRASRPRTPTDSLSVPACCFVQVEVQCEDPNLMQCGLEKCVAVDGSVEWVSAHSKVRLALSLSLSHPFSLAESQSFAVFSGSVHA